MQLPSILFSSLAALIFATPAASKPNLSEAPCPVPCSDGDAQRLNDAYISFETTDVERAKMKEIIAAKSAGGAVPWPVVAQEYFEWRAQTLGYTQLVAQDRTPSASEENADKVAEDAERRAVEQQRTFRDAAEKAVRQRLIDPDSARFEWPYGFMYGYWKPVLQKRVTGNWTCGRVNARNRMGGYSGTSSFVAVLDESGVPIYVEVGTGKDFDFTELGCAKAARVLPPPAPEVTEEPSSTAQSGSVADELEKLADLRDRGILTQDEFEAQKAKLLRDGS